MRTLVFIACALAASLAGPVRAEIASAQLDIQGLSLTVETPAITVPVNTPATIQTALNGRTGAAAASLPGIIVVGELTGPGIVQPIALTTTPDYEFRIPALPTAATFSLRYPISAPVSPPKRVTHGKRCNEKILRGEELCRASDEKAFRLE